MQLNLLKWAIICKGHCNLQNGLCCPGSHWRQSQRGEMGAGRDEDKDRLVCPPAPAHIRLSFLLSPSSDEHYTKNHGSSELRRAAEITQAPYFTVEKTEAQRGNITCLRLHSQSGVDLGPEPPHSHPNVFVNVNFQNTARLSPEF